MAIINKIINTGKILSDSAARYVNACGKTSILGTKPIKVVDVDGLRYVPELRADTLKISNQTPFAEFMRYIEGFKLEGEKYIPKSENQSSTFMEYFLHRKAVCVPVPYKKMQGLSVPARSAPPKIVRANDDKSFIMSLINFQNFMKTKSFFATKEEYYQITDEIARMMPEFVKKTHPELRPEIVENSGKIFKWRSLMDVEGKDAAGHLTKFKFFDEEAKMQAIKEYTQFVEQLTGKKVLIASPSRITIAVDELGILNNPDSYKNVDYILFGHGTGSSLITDITNPDTWRFSDTGESVWAFIEKNVPKGKKVLVGTCEKDKYWRPDGIIPKGRKALAEMYDKSGNYMYGIGSTVSASFGKTQPAKICESGVRHIIGHTQLETTHSIDSFIDGCYGKVKNVYYDL